MRLGTWTLYCQHYRVQKKHKKGAFSDGKMAMKNVKEQMQLHTKTRGSKCKGIASMYSKIAKNQLLKVGSEVGLEQHVYTKRMMLAGSEAKKDIFKMYLVVFCNAYDDCFYLSTKGEVNHLGHPYIEPEAVQQNGKTLNEDEMAFLKDS